MPPPPPPPRSALAEAETEQLLAELRALETADLLALCLRFRREPRRLGLYLTLFRARPGARAQFAATLVCFDLARGGHAVAQREFGVLAPTMSALAEDAELVAGLLGGDAYLEGLWRDCRAALAEDDPRQLWPSVEEETEVVGEIALLDDADLEIELPAPPPPPLPLDDPRTRAERHRFSEALLSHLGHEPETGTFDYGRGFRTGSGAEVERLERFVRSLDAFPQVAPARGLASLGPLFLAGHLRRHTLFGRPNPRRRAAVRAGLAALPADVEALATAAALFEFEGPEVLASFQKVSELLLDFLAFCSTEGLEPRADATVDRYVALNRAPPPLLASKRRRRA